MKRNLNMVKNNMHKLDVRLYWWRYEHPKRLNFGDESTRYIVERIFNSSVKWTPVREAEIIGAGSILEYCDEEHGKSDKKVSVWGSGFIHGDSVLKNDAYIFHAVRGKLSASRIGTKDIPVGDPGLLMSYAYPEYFTSTKTYDIGIIPHYVDSDDATVQKLRASKRVLVINPLNSPLEVARQINQCRIIFSSSLHGLIFADSYGIPNYWTPMSDKLTGGAYKFHDYYSIYDERARENDLLEAVQSWQTLASDFVSRDIATVQHRLIRAFPSAT